MEYLTQKKELKKRRFKNEAKEITIQAATCPPVYHTRWGLHTVPSNPEGQEKKL